MPPLPVAILAQVLPFISFHMELDDFKEHLRCYARVPLSHSADEALKLSHVLLQFSQAKVARVLETFPEAPIVFMHAADGWGVDIPQTVRFLAPNSGLKVTRAGKLRQEFLLQRGFLRRVRGDGSHELIATMSYPRGLGTGRSAFHIQGAMMEWQPLLRQRGFRGPQATVYLLDGLSFDALSRRLLARHQLHYQYSEDDEETVQKLRSSDLPFVLRCVSHGANRAPRWGLGRLLVGDILKDTHLAIEALLSNFAPLHAHVGDFLCRYVEFEEATDDWKDVQAFWLALGVDAGFVDVLVNYNIFWKGGKLVADARLQDADDGMEVLSAVVLHLLRWRKFTDTRFAGIGVSARFLVSSLAGGLDGVYAICQKHMTCGKDYLSQFSRATPAVREFVVVAALSTYPAEAVGIEVLADDRFVLRGRELFTVMQSELRYLHHLPALVWERLASLVSSQMSAGDMRHSVLQSAHCSCGYLWDDSFRQLEQLPWALTRGDILENLRTLQTQTRPQDMVAQRAWDFLFLGYPINKLKRLLEGVAHTAASTNVVEQCHASGKLCSDRIRLVEERRLAALSVCHQSRGQLHGSKTEERLVASQRALERLQNSRLQIHGFHAFKRRRFSRREISALIGEDVPKDVEELTLAEQHSVYRKLPRQVIKGLKEASARHNVPRAELLRQQKRELGEEIRQLEQRCEQERRVLGPNHITECRFTSGDWEELFEMYQNVDKDVLQTLQTRPLRAPELFEPDIQREIEENAPKKTRSCPDWARPICFNRVLWRMTAVCAGDPEGPIAWLVTHAKQQPYEISFLQLRRQPKVLDLTDAGEDDGSDFEIFPLKYACEESVPMDGSMELFVASGIFFHGERARCHSVFVPWADFISTHPPAPPRSKPKEFKPTVASDVRAQLLAEYPYLCEEELDEILRRPSAGPKAGKKAHGSAKGKSTGGAGADDASDTDDDASDSDGEFTVAELEAMRAEWETEAHSVMSFYVRLLGGKWTKKKKGVASDASCFFARGGLPKAWCKCYSMPKQRAFYFSKWGTIGAHMLSNILVHRCQYFYDIYENQDRDVYHYTEEDIAGCQNSLEFVEWLDSVDIMDDMFDVGCAIRRLAPTNP